jgi:hypothetical protein
MHPQPRAGDRRFGARIDYAAGNGARACSVRLETRQLLGRGRASRGEDEGHHETIAHAELTPLCKFRSYKRLGSQETRPAQRAYALLRRGRTFGLLQRISNASAPSNRYTIRY